MALFMKIEFIFIIVNSTLRPELLRLHMKILISCP